MCSSPELQSTVTKMVWPGPRFCASRMASATLIRGGAAEKQAFHFGEIEENLQRLFVRNLESEINGSINEIGGDAALANAFGDRGKPGDSSSPVV